MPKMLWQHRRRPTRLCKIKFVYPFVLINYINLSIKPRYHDGDDDSNDDDGNGRNHPAAVDNNGDDVGSRGSGRGRGRNHPANDRPTAEDQPAADHQHDLPSVPTRGPGTTPLPVANPTPPPPVIPE